MKVVEATERSQTWPVRAENPVSNRKEKPNHDRVPRDNRIRATKLFPVVFSELCLTARLDNENNFGLPISERWATKGIVNMKTQIIICSIVLTCFTSDLFSSDNSSKGGAFTFERLPVSQVLDIYAKVTGKKLVISTGALDTQSTITARRSHSKEIEDLIVEMLRNNAGVILTPIDGERVSVTYNDKLDPMPNGPPKPNKPSRLTPFSKR